MPHRPPPLLPEFAEDFLRDAAGQERSATWLSYRSGLAALQCCAWDLGLAATARPLRAKRLRVDTLAEFYSWLTKPHADTPEGREALRAGKPESVRHSGARLKRYRNASIQLYLIAAGQFYLWLQAGGRLKRGLTASDAQIKLRQKIGGKGQRIRPARREAKPELGLLLEFYGQQAAKLDGRPRLLALRNHALLQTLYATAGRAAEVIQIQRADVAGGQASQIEIIGKGGKRRRIPLSPDARLAIWAYLRARDLAEDTSSPLFVSHGRNKGEPLTTASLWRIVDQASREVFKTVNGKAKRHFGPHAFRHLRAQDLSDRGMPITDLQTVLGHASIATTRDIYAPKTPDANIEAALRKSSMPADEVIARARKISQRSS
jgi:site-specific recombinase XerD